MSSPRRGRGAARLGAALAALVALGACTRDERPPDLILISVDTLRPDHIGVYGHDGARTPRMDALAASGVRFTQATTSVPRTTPALASMLTGLGPRHHGARDVGQAIERGPTLAQLLRRRGYFGIGLSANPAADRPQQMHVGFDVFVGPEQLPGDGASDVTRIALKAAGLVDADLPLFLWVHYLDPHFPYHPPAGEKPPDAPACRALARDIHREVLTHGQAFTNFEGRAAAARDDCLALYDAEIAYTDHRIGALLDGLEALGRAERAIVVLTADHGESFGEMGLYFEHGPDVSDAGLRIPLVVAGEGIEPAVLDDPAQLEDLMPTLLGLLGVPAAERPATDGADLSARIRGDAPEAAARTTLAESGRALHVDMTRYPLSGLPAERHCVNDERYSLCRAPGEAGATLHDRENDPTLERDLGEAEPERRATLSAAAERWAPSGARQGSARTPSRKLIAKPRLEGGYSFELYAPDADPAHERDLAAEEPDTVARLRVALEPWLAAAETAVENELDDDALEALRELGYVE